MMCDGNSYKLFFEKKSQDKNTLIDFFLFKKKNQDVDIVQENCSNKAAMMWKFSKTLFFGKKNRDRGYFLC